MRDRCVEAIATILVDNSVEVKPGDLVLLSGPPLGAPLIEAVFRQVVIAAPTPQCRWHCPGWKSISCALCGGGEIWVDGELIYQDGDFTFHLSLS